MELKYPYKQILIITEGALGIRALIYFLKRTIFSEDMPKDIYGQGAVYLKFAILVIFIFGIIFLIRTATSYIQKKNI